MYYDTLFVEANLPKPLNQEEIYALFKKMMAGDLNAREEIIQHNIRLVINIVVKNFSTSPYDQKELVSIGIIGLIKSVDTFDINKKLQFATYATRCIQNEILMFMRKGKKYIFNESLDKPLTTDKDGHEYKVEDTIEDISSDFVTDYENKEVYKNIRQIVENLNERDSLIIKLHFGFETENPISQKEIAKSLGISQPYVSRIIKNVLKKISQSLQKQGLIELSQKVEITKKEKYPKRLQSIYEYFKNYNKEDIDLIISNLRKEEKELIVLRYGNDLEHPTVSPDWTKEMSTEFYSVLIPKIKRALLNLENQKINEIQTSSQEFSYEEYVKTIELLKKTNFTQ